MTECGISVAFFASEKVLEFRHRPVATSWGDHEVAGFLASEEGWALEQGGKGRSSTT